MLQKERREGITCLYRMKGNDKDYEKEIYRYRYI